MKKLILFLFSLTLFCSSSYGIYYNFYNFPVSSKTVDYRNKDGYDFVVFNGKTQIDREMKKIDLSYLQSILKEIQFFKFFKLGYYYENTLSNISDGKINLSYLDKKKLVYPIASIYTLDKMIFVIHQNAFSPSYQSIIGTSYQSTRFRIVKSGDYYIVSLRFTDEYKNNNNKNYYSYAYKKYFDALSSVYNGSDSIVNFQVGQNPFEKNEIQGFDYNFLQLEYVYSNRIVGIILSLKKDFSLKVITDNLTFSDDYTIDKTMMDNINDLYSEIRAYYRNFGDLPQDLGSLQPMFEDITALNPNNHTLFYERLDTKCFNIGFKPKADSFKKVYSTEINKKGFWFTKMCIK